MKQNNTARKLFDRKIEFCQLLTKKKRSDFIFAYLNNITQLYTNFTVCPILPGVYKMQDFVFDAKVIPKFIALADKNVTLSAIHYSKLKKLADVRFLDIDFRLRYKN